VELQRPKDYSNGALDSESFGGCAVRRFPQVQRLSHKKSRDIPPDLGRGFSTVTGVGNEAGRRD
jgi:hypothetical protein